MIGADDPSGVNTIFSLKPSMPSVATFGPFFFVFAAPESVSLSVVLPTLPSPTIINFTVENTLLSASSSRRNLKIAFGVERISLGIYAGKRNSVCVLRD